MVKKRKTTEQQEGESPLKKLRDELDLSQEDFGRAIGTTVRTVGRWEAGDSVPTFTIPQMKALIRLLESHGKTIDDLPDELGPRKQTQTKEVNSR